MGFPARWTRLSDIKIQQFSRRAAVRAAVSTAII
jgi:hypothetical protein